MRKARKKAVSIIVTLTFLLGLVFAYAGPAAAATYCEFTGGYTNVIADENQIGGTAEVRQSVRDTVYQWNKAGVDTVLISVTLPSGVEYMKAPERDNTNSVAYNVYYADIEAGVTPGFVSGSTNYLEIKLSDTTNKFNYPVKVVFKFSEAGKSALKIDPDFTGDVKAVVEVIGIASGAVKFRESEAITVARVAADKTITISAAEPKVVSVGSNKEGAKITVAETIAGAVYVGTGTAIKLEILTSGVEFASTAGTANGIRLTAENPARDANDFTVATVRITGRDVQGVPGKVEITPKLDVSPAASGDIKIKVTAYKAGGGTVSETVTVAKVTDKITFTVTDVKNTGGKVYAGHGAATLKENDKEAQFAIKPAAGNFPGDTLIYVDIVGATFNQEFTATGADGNVHLYNDGKSAWFKAGNVDKITLRGFNVKAGSDAAAGDIVLKLGSNLGSFDTTEVVIGKVVKPVNVEASGAPEIAYLGRGQAAGSITITEAKAGAILKDGLKLTLPEGVKFSGKPTVKVAEGNIDVDASLTSDNSALVLKVTKKSATASKIEITDIKYDVTRLALDGDVEVKVVGYDAGNSPTTFEWADTKTLATVVNAKVVSEAAAPAPTKREASFVIGSTTYKVNGEEKTMDVAPYIDAASGRTYLPVRYVAYALGVSEDNIFYSNGQVSLLKDGRAVQMTIGSKALVVNGVSITMDAAPVIKDGRTMLPFRWIATALGASVSWDEATKTVTMTIE